MQVYCGFCGAPTTTRARFCRACRRLIALPGGTTTAPATERPGWQGALPMPRHDTAGGWPAEWQVGEAPAPLSPRRLEQALGWPVPPAADLERRWPAPDTLLPVLPQTSIRLAPAGDLPPSGFVLPVPLQVPGPVEYLIDHHTGFPYDPHYPAPAPAVRDGSVATFFPRLGALLVDYCILSVLWFGLVGAAALVDSAALGLLATFLGPALYFIIFWSAGGRTPGQRAAGLQLLRTDGSRVGVRAAVVRYLGTLLSLPLFFLGYLWMLWDPAGQTWHDKLADTMVVQS